MRILFITQFFRPDIQATSKLFYELCEELSSEHEVCVLAGMPLVEPRRFFSDSPPEEVVGNIRIVRVKTARKVKKTLGDRILNHLSYFINAFFKCAQLKACDLVIYTSDNPLNVILASILLRKPKIFLNQDLYAEQAHRTGAVRGVLFWILKSLQFLSFGVADRIVVIGDLMKDYLVCEKRIPAGKIDVITNWADICKLKSKSKHNDFSIEHGLEDKFVVLHSGRLGITQNLELLVRCAAELKDRKDIQFVIIGEGAKKSSIKKLAKELSPGNIKFLHYQHEEILSDVFSTADVAVILFNCCLSHSLVPSRLFSFMACARPVLASIDPKCVAANIIQDSGCGKVIGIGDLEALKQSILAFYEDPVLRETSGNMGRAYVEKHFSRKEMTGRYLKLIGQFSSVVDERKACYGG